MSFHVWSYCVVCLSRLLCPILSCLVLSCPVSVCLPCVVCSDVLVMRVFQCCVSFACMWCGVVVVCCLCVVCFMVQAERRLGLKKRRVAEPKTADSPRRRDQGVELVVPEA